jgi:hypothetical protein
VNREVHAGICGSRRVKFPPATRPWAPASSGRAYHRPPESVVGAGPGLVRRFDEIRVTVDALEDRRKAPPRPPGPLAGQAAVPFSTRDLLYLILTRRHKRAGQDSRLR